VASQPLPSHPSTGADRLALAALELARVEAACRFDGCGPDCSVAASVRRSYESLLRPGAPGPAEAAA